MFLEHPEEKNLKEITLDEFEIHLMELVRKNVQPERLSPKDTIFEEISEYGSKGKFGLINSVSDSPSSENK